MTWTRLGSEFLTDPRLLAVSRSDRLLLIELFVWCNEQNTDGAVPRHVPVRLSDARRTSDACKRLTESGLLETTGDGWHITDFLKQQPSAADVERTQTLAKERQRRQRQHRGGDHSLCDPKYCNQARVTRDVTRDQRVSHDARTDPTRLERMEAGG